MYKTYSEELKKKAVFSVLSGALRKREAAATYGVSSRSLLDSWIERYGQGILSSHKELLQEMGTRKKKEAVKGEIPELEEMRKELANTRRSLRAAELRAEADSMMIDLAEKELKVAIRKKSGTK